MDPSESPSSTRPQKSASAGMRYGSVAPAKVEHGVKWGAKRALCFAEM
jgi:hypothetical protein